MKEDEKKRIRKKGHAVYDGDGREALHGGEVRDDQVSAFFPPHAVSPVFHPLPLRQLHPTLLRDFITKNSIQRFVILNLFHNLKG